MTPAVRPDPVTTLKLLERECRHPYRVTDGMGREFWTRCGSREAHVCPSCSRLTVGDWSAIARSGVFDAPPEVGDHRWYFLTLTAPSFGGVHHVPRPHQAPHCCRCGATHLSTDGHLRGAAVRPDTYDYVGQVRWNNGAGHLWDRTRTRLDRLMPSMSYFAVREWQARGVLHLHVILRVPTTSALPAAAVAVEAQESTTVVPWTGFGMSWGKQVDCREIAPAGDATARALGYLVKYISYSMKDIDDGRRSASALHARRLDDAARQVPCDAGCRPRKCGAKAHRRYGARAKIVHAAHSWSWSGLTRTRQRADRAQWATDHPVEHQAWRRESQDRMTAVHHLGTWVGRHLVDTRTGEVIAWTGNVTDPSPHREASGSVPAAQCPIAGPEPP